MRWATVVRYGPHPPVSDPSRAHPESFKFSDRVHNIAITGGTGEYEGATGTVTSGLEGLGEDDLRFRVRLP